MNINLEILKNIDLNKIETLNYYNKQSGFVDFIPYITDCYIKDKYLIVESKQEGEAHIYALNLNQVYIIDMKME